ncbi:udp-n-acetylglucosaminyltransferase [Grosmannia clavigera kw1407]|uniref:protein O-GlcNAc transferase n=1 Tax=Grosmannia clavigera (strain kw1407 / UAMH 11150) TaxID=655863 RepID=F0XMC8_GROCL|nr:udp-n-acetylglucosaminyltransferase [Grosmannia clavigera kw1407]EFX01123.1 udp-n-acetylglucosaminyltransferase [Grosmannia clavigera kw1407]
MQQPLVQMSPQMGHSPLYFDNFHHVHLRPEYIFALQQQQLQQQAQHQYYLSQSRSVRPQSFHQAAAVAAPQRTVAFPIRNSQSTAVSLGSQVPHSQLQHHLQNNGRPVPNLAPGAGGGANGAAFPYINSGRSLAERFQEHQLRRKTPNGTIDAGYDGSPSSLATGPPPFKQMALSVPSVIFPTAVVQQNGPVRRMQMQQLVAATATTTGLPSRSNVVAGQPLVQTDVWPYQLTSVRAATSAAAAASAARSGFGAPWMGPETINPEAAKVAATLNNVPNMAACQGALLQASTFFDEPRGHDSSNMFPQPVFSPSYQASPGPTAFNPTSFNPQPIWPDSALLQSYQTHGFPLTKLVNVDNSLSPIPQIGVCNANYRQTAQATQPLFPLAAPNLNMAPSITASSQPNMFSYHSAQISSYNTGQFHQGVQRQAPGRSQSQQPMNMDSSAMLHSPIQALQMLSMGPPSSALPAAVNISATGEGLVQFKERVLAQGEKTYAELLVHLTHTKKSLNGRPLPSLRPPMKTSMHSKSSQRQQQQQAFSACGLVSEPHMAAVQMSHGRQSLLDHRHGTAHYPSAIVNDAGIYQPSVANIHGAQAAVQNMFFPHPPLIPQAKATLELLSSLCEQSDWKWTDGMLLGGCLHYGLDHFEQALEWFNRILSLNPGHVEVVSNIAATLYCLDRRDEAEKFWYQAIHARPSYLEPAEHLASLLAADQRNHEAVDMIDFVQDSLRIQRPIGSVNSGSSANCGGGPEVAGTTPISGYKVSVHNDDRDSSSQGSPDNTNTQPGFGSSGYAVPGHDNGRMLILIHTKANILYAMKETASASKAYEEAVLIGTGRGFQRIQTLIQRVHATLSPADVSQGSLSYFPRSTASPPLLSPDRAKLTAHLVFASTHGQLPGLRYIPESQHRKSAIATTSNALLSMAKILQDGMASTGYAPAGPNGQGSAVADILALYYLSLSLQESPSTANNVGILLASVQQTPIPSDSQSQRQKPQQQLSSVVEPATKQAIPAGITPGSGLALAFAYYSYGLRLDPKHVHLHTNLGSLLKDVGQIDLAIKMYEQAVACDGTFDIALTNLANAVKDRGRILDAISYYRRAVISNPDFSEAVCGLSTALNSVCDWRGRGGVFLENGRYDRWHVDDDGMLRDVCQTWHGLGLTKRVVDIVSRQLEEGSSWGKGVLHESAIAMLACQMKDATGVLGRDSGFDIGEGGGDGVNSAEVATELQKWANQTGEGSRVLRLIERATRVVMRRWYHDRYVRGVEVPNNYARPRLPASLTVPAAPTVLPFHTFTCPLPAKDVRLISQRNALRISCSTLRSPWLSGSVYPPPSPPQPQLNIGYISSDFNNHPLAHLSIHRQQIEREAPVFRDVTNWAPERLIEQILQDNIHILVNLNGYTRGARNEIFAARPAPIQMAFMGFAGTLGAEWCDYLLADTTAVPPSTLRPWRGNVSIGDVFRDEAEAGQENWVYSENIIYCRDTFFCCDHKQSAEASERAMTWQDEQRRRWKMRKELFPNISDDTVILGNFNQLYKIDPTTFRSWLRILAGVPNAILWLLRFPEAGEANLRRTALTWAGESVACRIIFTDVAPKHLHIARASVCDIFLDTPECNAHTTAADVLWSGTPLLTLPRYNYKMCSRIAASILRGALPKDAEGKQAAAELIAVDESDYEKSAIRLANNSTYTMKRYTGNGTDELYGEGHDDYSLAATLSCLEIEYSPGIIVVVPQAIVSVPQKLIGR